MPRRDMLARAAPAERVRLLLDYAPGLGVREVPDPYYGEPGDFEYVLDIVQAAARGLLDAVTGQAAAAGSSPRSS